MSHGRIVRNKHGRKLHVGGRKRPIATPQSHPHLFRSLKSLLRDTPSFPDVPDVDYFAEAGAGIHDILGNDTLGDCTAAGACHGVEVFNGNAGNPLVLTRDDAVKFYSLSTGYDPSDPTTDQGGDEVTVCTTWRDKGLDGQGAHAIAGWVTVDATNIQEVRWAAWAFELLYFGVELDDSFTQVSGDGFTWGTGSPDPNDGHCVVGAKTSSAGVGIDSWGFLGTFTWAGVAQFASQASYGNLFAVYSKESLARATQKAPNQLDWNAIAADAAQMSSP